MKYKKSNTTETKKEENTLNNNKKETTMAFDKVLSALQERANAANPLGSSIKFDFGGQQILIDGKGDSNEVSASDGAADCTVKIEADDLKAMIDGELNPMSAFMSGKFKIEGDMSVAMKLSQLFS